MDAQLIEQQQFLHLLGSRPKKAKAFVVPAADHLQKSYRDDEALDVLEEAVRLKPDYDEARKNRNDLRRILDGMKLIKSLERTMILIGATNCQLQ